MTTSTGSCICGSISVTTQSLPKVFGACHCSVCRNWGGGPLLAINCKQDLEIHGDEQLAVYASSAWAERGFCNQCGTHLFCRLKQANHYLVPVGLFEHNEELTLDHQIFIDSKPDNYNFENATSNLTGKQVMAQFTNKPD